MNNKQPVRVFSDFDGTISSKDVGASLFNHFSNKRNSGTVRLWIEQKISSRECLWRECSFIKASKAEMIDALHRIDVSEGFPEFVQLLSENGIPLHIVSDGLDFYIDAFLSRVGLSHLDIHANRAHFVNGNLYPSFPYFNQGCGSCGTCKGERVKSMSKPGELTVFVGDGYSDRCALGVAGILFARDDLARLAEEKSVAYLPFTNFLDIIDYFRKNLV